MAQPQRGGDGKALVAGHLKKELLFFCINQEKIELLLHTMVLILDGISERGAQITYRVKTVISSV